MNTLSTRLQSEVVKMPTFNVGLKAVVLNAKNEMLLLQRSNENTVAEKWDIPGGRMSFGESLGEALEREVREEAGLELGTIGAALNICTFPRDIDAKNQIVRITFAVRARGDITLSDEHQDYAWVPLDRVGEHSLFSPTVEMAAKRAKELLENYPDSLFLSPVATEFVN